MSSVDHPKHYNELGAVCAKCDQPIECIDVAERMSFNIGNAVKYLWRAGRKTESPLEDLEKAIWYIRREIGARIQSDVERIPDGAYCDTNAMVRVWAIGGKERDVPVCKGDTAKVIGTNVLAAMGTWTK